MNIENLLELQKRTNKVLQSTVVYSKPDMGGLFTNALQSKIAQIGVVHGSHTYGLGGFMVGEGQAPTFAVDHDMPFDEQVKADGGRVPVQLYAEGLFFVLCLYAHYGKTDVSITELPYHRTVDNRILDLMSETLKISRQDYKKGTYGSLIEQYVFLGRELGFTDEQIEEAYTEECKFKLNSADLASVVLSGQL